MRLINLAASSIKRNFSKYVMYFFTLSFSVFTVYSFMALLQNEYVSQAFSHRHYRGLLSAFGVIIFVFVMFFLISSNASFVRARKKEISMYLLFGMTNRQIGNLLFLETMLVGLAALLVGIGAGVFFSKLIAMILLEIALDSFVGNIVFTFNPLSVYFTILPFLLVFGVIGLSGRRVIARFELVELFAGEKMAERSPKGSLFMLLLSLAFIGTGYYLAASTDSYLLAGYTLPILISVIAGTYLFFGGGLPRILRWIKKRPRKYYRGDNLLAISAFIHRVGSIGSTMATIAVLSAVATTAVATGFNLYTNIERDTYGQLGYDMYFYGGQDQLLEKVYAAFETHGIDLVGEYTADRLQAKPQAKITFGEGKVTYYDDTNGDEYFRIFSQSESNNLLALSRSGLKPVQIKPGEAVCIGYFYTNVPNLTEEIHQAIMAEPLRFSRQTIKITSFLEADFLLFGARRAIIVSDADFAALSASGEILAGSSSENPFDQVTVFKYKNPLKSSAFSQEINQILTGKVGSYRLAYNHFVEYLEVYGLVCFIGFFMSAVFILMTASLLYFQQIMAAQEERHQYNMLRKIGMDNRTQKHVITKRLLPVFLLPLIVGIIHSMFAMKTADSILFSSMITAENSYLVVLGLSGMMYGIYALVYGLFYLITKQQYTKIVSYL